MYILQTSFEHSFTNNAFYQCLKRPHSKKGKAAGQQFIKHFHYENLLKAKLTTDDKFRLPRTGDIKNVKTEKTIQKQSRFLYCI